MEIDRETIDCLLQSCLDEVSGGQETIDSVLTKYPEIQEDLRKELEAAVWFHSRKDQLAARPGFIRRSRRHLYTQIRQENPTRQFFKRKKTLRRWERSPAVQLILAILLVFALLANTNSLMAASSASAPGDQFYGLKLARENVQLALANSPARQGELNTQIARDRLGEMVASILEGRTDNLPGLVLDYEAHAGEAVIALRLLTSQDREATLELAAVLESSVFKQAEILGLLVHSVPDEQAPYVEQALRVSEMGVSSVQALLREQAALP